MFRGFVSFLRSKLRAWLGVATVPADESIPVSAQRKGISIAQEVLRRAGEKNIVPRKFQAPKLIEGVLPRMMPTDDPGGTGSYVALDSEFNAPAYAYANQSNCGLGFPGYAYLSELSQRSEYRAPSETIASEMTRVFVTLIVKGKAERGDSTELQDKIEKLTDALEKYKIQEMFCKLAELDGLFGRAQLFIDIDTRGRDVDAIRQLPLCIDAETIPKGSLRGFKVIEPIWTTPFSYNASDPMAPDFYKPRAWFVLGKRVHADRLLTFISREVPDILKPAYNFGGISMTQLMESDVFQWLRTRNSVSDLIHNFSVMCLLTDMTNILSGQPDKPGGLFDRATLFTQTRDNQGLTMLDKDREELAAVNVPLSSLDKLQAQAQEHQAAPSHIPLVKLIGVTPSGLNASSEGEIQVFYDFVQACKQKFFAPHFRIVLQILQLHLFGCIDDAIGFEFPPLHSPTVKELSEIRKADAETDAIYISNGVIDPAESRERVASDPISGYNNLSGDPPAPPMEQEHELGQQAAEADHARGEESAEAAHERQLKEQKAQPRAA
jgi:phage-related protein (TIGR01555 family)